MSGWTDWRGWFPKNFPMIEVVVVVLIVALFAIIIFASTVENEARLKFMADCMTEHKEYECTLMWKEAQPDTRTVVIPVYTQ